MMMKRFVQGALLCGCLLAPAFSATESAGVKTWLADLKGLPTREEIETLSTHVDKVMQQEKAKTCTAINSRLRKMIFLHFAAYQHLLNKRGIYLTEQNVERWSKVFGMLLKESSGDTTSISSMTGRTYTTYQPKTNLSRWRTIAKMSKNDKIPLNYQTNFGLTQLSVDRLFVALQLALDPAYLKDRKIEDLNTAIAIRKLVWFYQDFAQGRLSDSHDRIHEKQAGSPEYADRFSFGISTALLLCGTNYMFYEGYHDKATGIANLTDAMASIAYCKLGDDAKGFGRTEENEKCFAKWVTLCPNLNFDIAMLTPMRYFETRNAAPVCEGTFKALLTKKTAHSSQPAVQHQKIKHASNTVTSAPEPQVPGSRIKKILDSVSLLFQKLLVRAD